ncbi:MAG: hypothetical protein A2Y25_07935 [Candidatus Melainabacteria bacterium GWF2_37_15]|nr:MAG: hypothetical protein A2Y25_07935 [Candidatus Melainabacteria bacterium GWF2_37_15]
MISLNTVRFNPIQQNRSLENRGKQQVRFGNIANILDHGPIHPIEEEELREEIDRTIRRYNKREDKDNPNASGPEKQEDFRMFLGSTLHDIKIHSLRSRDKAEELKAEAIEYEETVRKAVDLEIQASDFERKANKLRIEAQELTGDENLGEQAASCNEQAQKYDRADKILGRIIKDYIPLLPPNSKDGEDTLVKFLKK